MTTKFNCDAKTFKYKKTRRGVDAICEIKMGDVVIATLYDVAEQIVAKVDFCGPAMREKFLKEAKANGYNGKDEMYAISEYARTLAMAAEQDMLSATKV